VKIIKIHKYRTPFGTIEFVPYENLPGFSHRIVIDSRWTDWYLDSNKRPDSKAARFFARMNGALEEGRDKYFYTDRNIDPPDPVVMRQVGVTDKETVDKIAVMFQLDQKEARCLYETAMYRGVDAIRRVDRRIVCDPKTNKDFVFLDVTAIQSGQREKFIVDANSMPM